MIALSLALLLAAAQPATTPTPAPAASLPAATPDPILTPAVAATPVASPPASPAALPSPPAATSPAVPTPSAPPPLPEPTIAYAYRFVPHQPAHAVEGQPQIFAVYLNSNKLKSLGPIDIKVATSPNVVRVFTHSNGHDGDIPMISSGDFEAVGKLPKLPFIASGVSTTIDFVAVGPGGKRVTVPVPVLLQ